MSTPPSSTRAGAPTECSGWLYLIADARRADAGSFDHDPGGSQRHAVASGSPTFTDYRSLVRI